MGQIWCKLGQLSRRKKQTRRCWGRLTMGQGSWACLLVAHAAAEAGPGVLAAMAQVLAWGLLGLRAQMAATRGRGAVNAGVDRVVLLSNRGATGPGGGKSAGGGGLQGTGRRRGEPARTKASGTQRWNLAGRWGSNRGGRPWHPRTWTARPRWRTQRGDARRRPGTQRGPRSLSRAHGRGRPGRCWRRDLARC